jgi:hypothetical protein
MDDNSIMPIGKHKGKRMEKVPAEYLLWLYGAYNKTQNASRTEQDKEVFEYIVDNLDVLKFQVKQNKR